MDFPTQVGAETGPVFRLRGRGPSGRLGSQERQEERAAYLFLLPWFAGLLFFLVIPLLWSVYMSMTDEQLLRPGKFVGLSNYVYMFTGDQRFYKALQVTFTWIVFAVPFFLITGLLLSLLLNQRLRGMYLFRTILYIPAVLSGVAVTILWLVLLNPDLGAVNSVLRAVGIENPPAWFESPTWALPALAITGLWGVGSGAIIYLAGLQNIPPQLYEAASIDGAGPLSKFRHITLPMLSPTIFFLVVDGVAGALVTFGPAFVLGGGGGASGPEDSLLFYLLYMYQRGFIEGLVGYTAALGWVLTLMGCVLVFLIFRFEKRFVFYETE